MWLGRKVPWIFIHITKTKGGEKGLHEKSALSMNDGASDERSGRWTAWSRRRPNGEVFVRRPRGADGQAAAAASRQRLNADGLRCLLEQLVRDGTSLQVRSLDVSNEPLHSDAGPVLEEFLGDERRFPRLEHLDVRYTYLDERGCLHIAALIWRRGRSGLCCLDAARSGMTQYAHAELLAAMRATGQTVRFTTGRDPGGSGDAAEQDRARLLGAHRAERAERITSLVDAALQNCRGVKLHEVLQRVAVYAS